MTLLELLETNNNYLALSGRPEASNVHGTDKEYLHGHHYVTSFYEEHFHKYKDKEINLLEIGVHFGGSMFLWNDYFQKGMIYGVDVKDEVNPIMNTYPRIKRFLSDAYSSSFASTLPDFDIVIDDGPHTLASFEQCLRLYLPKVKEGGLLVIEDIPSIDHIKYLQIIAEGYETKVIDTREKYGRYDNIMFAVFK